MNRAFFRVFLGACALLIFFVVMLLPRLALTASSGQAEWERVLQAAKSEGVVNTKA